VAAGAASPRPVPALIGINPTNVADLRRAFALLRKPRNLKALAQNFLVDVGARDAIIRAASLSAEDEVLEIGPGSGVLTQQLVARAARVVAIDVDPYMLELTRAVCAGARNLELKFQDVRKVNLPETFPSCRYVAVGNLPYYLTGYVLELLTSSSCSPHRIVLTVQKEVADRLVARAGDHTLLSISVGTFGRVELVQTLSFRSFWPQPKVDSAVVRIERHAKPPVPASERRAFFRVVRAGFSARRKKLSNALAGGLRTTPSVVATVLRDAGLGENARAQELTIEQWATLSRKFVAAELA